MTASKEAEEEEDMAIVLPSNRESELGTCSCVLIERLTAGRADNEVVYGAEGAK